MGTSKAAMMNTIIISMQLVYISIDLLGAHGAVVLERLKNFGMVSF